MEKLFLRTGFIVWLIIAALVIGVVVLGVLWGFRAISRTVSLIRFWRRGRIIQGNPALTREVFKSAWRHFKDEITGHVGDRYGMHDGGIWKGVGDWELPKPPAV